MGGPRPSTPVASRATCCDTSGVGDDEADRADEADLADKFINGLIEDAIFRGELTLDGKSDDEIAISVQDFLNELRSQAARGEIEFAMTVDYSETLRTEAKRLREAGRDELAITMHATHVEHWLNNMLRSGANRMGLCEPDATDLIRDTNLRVKMGWLWTLLFGSEFPSDIKKRIFRLSERRNAFVHYKWPAEADDPTKGAAEAENLREISASAPALLDDLIELEDSLLFAKQRGALQRVLDARTTERK